MPSAQASQLYPNLFSPIRIGSLELPNRITMAAMYTASGSANGMVTERQINYYRARAAAGERRADARRFRPSCSKRAAPS